MTVVQRIAGTWVDEPSLEDAACPVCGRDSCENHLPASLTTPPLRFKSAAELVRAPRPVEIMEGVAWAGCLTVLVAESGTGKTFVLLSQAAAVSDGVPWHGRAVLQGSVAYFLFEGDAIGTRVAALMEIGGARTDHLYVERFHDPLSPHVTRDGETRSIGELTATATLDILKADIAAAGKPPIALLIIDTVRASLAGSEDSSEHVAAYLRAGRRLMATVPTAAAIFAHHAGWQDGDQQRKRERGSSAWRGNCDATLYLEAGDHDADRGETRLTLRTLKVRDAERPAPLHLIRRTVELPEMDRRGQPVTSCIIEQDRRSRDDRDAEALALVAREDHLTDVNTLRAIADHPDLATSQDRLRLLLGTRKTVVGTSLTRLVRKGWVLPGTRKQPYTLTDTGRATLLEGAP